MENLAKCSKKKVGQKNMWEVCFDYGTHMSKTLNINASTKEDACAKVKKQAQKLTECSRGIMINWQGK